MIKGLFLLPILLYRYLVSPFLAPRCRFFPGCSAYAAEAIRTHGAAYGLYLATKRLLKCHPFHPGGYDPVPPLDKVEKTEKRLDPYYG